MSYQFLDAYGSVLSAAANTVGGAQQPIVQISSITGNLSASVIGLTPFNLTHVLGGQAGVAANGAVGVNTLRVAIATDSAGPGSVISFPQPASVSGVGLFNVNHTGNGSILAVGTYAEDAAHTTGNSGIFVLGVRNDTMSSITSTDGDYTPIVTGPTGEVITANSPITKWWNTQTSVMYGVSVLAQAAPGASVFNYLSGIQVANDSGTFSRVKITGGLGSVLAWTVAPANGGSNITFINPIKTGENSGISASINGVSSIYITMQGFTSKT